MIVRRKPVQTRIQLLESRRKAEEQRLRAIRRSQSRTKRCDVG